MISSEERVRSMVENLLSAGGELVHEFKEDGCRELILYPFPQLVNEYYNIPERLMSLGVMDDRASKSLKMLEGVLAQLNGLIVRCFDHSFKISVEGLRVRVLVHGPQSVDESIKDRITRSLTPFWELAEYARYLMLTRREQAVAEQVLSQLPKRLRKYVNVTIGADENTVQLFVAEQIKGLIIGKQGSRVKELEKKVGMKVAVHSYRMLTELYEKEQLEPEIPQDPEAVKDVAEAINLLRKIWERYGIEPEKVAKLVPKDEAT